MACIISLERVLFSTQHIFIGAFVISSLSHRVSDCWVACARSETPSRNQSQGLPRDWDQHEGHCSAAVLWQDYWRRLRNAKKAELLAQKMMLFKSCSKSCDASQLWWNTLFFGQRSNFMQLSVGPILVRSFFAILVASRQELPPEVFALSWIG